MSWPTEDQERGIREMKCGRSFWGPRTGWSSVNISDDTTLVTYSQLLFVVSIRMREAHLRRFERKSGGCLWFGSAKLDLTLYPHPFCTHRRKDGAPERPSRSLRACRPPYTTTGASQPAYTLRLHMFLASYYKQLYNFWPMPDAPDSASERSSTKSQWNNRIISAVLGILVTVVAALILGRLQAREAHLIYSSSESLPFNGSNGDVSIYQVTISNDGKQEVNEVACSVRIPSAKIDQYRVTASPLLNVLVSVSGDSVSVQIPNLNPAESAQISLLATGVQALPARPEVALRGRGITGSEKTPSGEAPSESPIFYVSLATASLAVVLTGAFRTLLRKGSSTGTSLGSGDDQRQVLAYILRAYGLRELADQYSAQAHETTYWAEADRLGQIATDSKDVDTMGKIERALLGLIEYQGMAYASKAIVYYNVALINKFKNDDVNSQKYLGLAIKTDSSEIKQRLKVDPRFVAE
jgi:hypothetical protein